MEAHVITPKLIISIIIFFVVCLMGSILEVQAKPLTSGYVPDETVRLKLIAVENETETMEFQIFYSFNQSQAFVFPRSTFRFMHDQQISLNPYNLLTVKCCKGSYVPVFIQDGGYASGSVEDDFEGPFYISLWLHTPNVPEANKTHVCYAIKKGQIGTIGIRIGQKGDYRLVAYEHVKFITPENKD